MGDLLNGALGYFVQSTQPPKRGIAGQCSRIRIIRILFFENTYVFLRIFPFHT